MRTTPFGALAGAILALLPLKANGPSSSSLRNRVSAGTGRPSARGVWTKRFRIRRRCNPGTRSGCGRDVPWKFASQLTGTAAAPIVVRVYPGEWRRSTADREPGRAGHPSGDGAYTWYWGFEIMSSDPKRQSSQNGPWPTDITRGSCASTNDGHGAGVKFINIVCHDGAGGSTVEGRVGRGGVRQPDLLQRLERCDGRRHGTGSTCRTSPDRSF